MPTPRKFTRTAPAGFKPATPEQIAEGRAKVKAIMGRHEKTLDELAAGIKADAENLYVALGLLCERGQKTQTRHARMAALECAKKCKTVRQLLSQVNAEIAGEDK